MDWLVGQQVPRWLVVCLCAAGKGWDFPFRPVQQGRKGLELSEVTRSLDAAVDVDARLN